MRRRGNVVVVLARFLPGIRAPTYFTAGHARLPYWEFLLFDGVGRAGLGAALGLPGLLLRVRHRGGGPTRPQRFGHYILAAMTVVVVILALRWLRARRARAAVPSPPPEPAENNVCNSRPEIPRPRDDRTA